MWEHQFRCQSNYWCTYVGLAGHTESFIDRKLIEKHVSDPRQNIKKNDFVTDMEVSVGVCIQTKRTLLSVKHIGNVFYLPLYFRDYHWLRQF